MTSIVHEVDAAKGTYRIPDREAFEKIPEWTWYELFALTGRPLAPKPVSKRSKRNKNNK